MADAHPIGLPDLVSVLGRTVREPEVRALFAGIEFLKFNQKWSGGDQSAPNSHGARSKGFEFCTDGNGTIRLAYVYALDAKPGFDPFRGPLFGDITFSMGPDAVHETLGPPSKSGPAQALPRMGKLGPWDRWDRETFSLHIQYIPSGRRIQTITVMSPDMVP